MKLLNFITQNVGELICEVFVLVAFISWDIGTEPSKFKIFFVSLTVIYAILVCIVWIKKYKEFKD